MQIKITSQSRSPEPNEWNAEQKEIWKCLTDKWDLLVKAKVDEFLEYIHPEFRGFGHESPLMLNKDWLAKWVRFWTQTTKIPIYYIVPVSCAVYGDMAILQYVIFTIEKSAERGGRSARRYTMTWIKNNKRWQVLASHNNLMTEEVKAG